MKIFVTGTRGIPDIMGGVETHCEELFPRIASMDNEVTINGEATMCMIHWQNGKV